LSGARIERNADNRGFVEAVNQAAGQARGEALLLLNNDAELQSGALTAALTTLESSSDIGAVGARIVLLDGRLQEAGSLIWRDGSCLGYGRGEDPDRPEFRFRREVDYCSGAFLLTPRALFEQMGGFDVAFAPAYYEETDYCTRLRKAGYRVLYEPEATIRHFEFASSASPAKAIALQQAHREVFCQRHADFLAGQPEPDPARILFARSPRTRRRVLLLDDRVPYPSLGAGYPRCRDLVMTLVELGFEVTFYPILADHEDWSQVHASLPVEVEVKIGAGLVGLADFLRARQGFYDVVTISRPHNMRLVNAALAGDFSVFAGSRLIYDAEAVIAARDLMRRRLAGQVISEQAGHELVDQELALAEPADQVVTVSSREADLFRQRGFEQVDVLGHRVEPDPGPADFERRRGVVFVGALRDDDSPNVDSLLWFYDEVAPLMVAGLGDEFVLYVVGDASAAGLARLDADWIRFLGRLDDLHLPFDACRVFIAPTRFAAGIPHKLHAAAGGGIPAVATSLLANQLGWSHERELLVADSAADFASACLRLHTDPELWATVRRNALAAIERDCSPRKFKAAVQAIYGDGRFKV
jgi:glycosyltransferase involved in cell wall biosynthesis